MSRNAKQSTTTLTGPAPLQDAVWLNTSEIRVSPYQPRTHIDWSELVPSIKARGVDTPILVRPIRDGKKVILYYELVDGERRWRGSQEAGQPRIPARVREFTDLEARERAYLLNKEREDFTDYDDARAMLGIWNHRAEIEHRTISQNEMIRLYGKRVMNLKKLMEVCEVAPELQAIASAFPGVMTQIFTINGTRGELRQELLKLFDVKKKKRASVNDVNDFIANWKADRKEEKESYTPPAREDAQRTKAHEESGGGSVSRGRMVQSHSKRECNEGAQGAANAAASNLETVRQWIERGGTVPKASLMEARRRIDALLGISD